MRTDIQDETPHPSPALKRPKPPRDKLPQGERLLDVREAAAVLGLKPSTLYQWAYERKIPVVKPNRLVWQPYPGGRHGDRRRG